MKELGVYKDVGYSILLPKKLKRTTQSTWSTKHRYEISWSSGYKIYTELQKKLKNLIASETENFANVFENCTSLSELLETKIRSLDDYACPKNKNLIFKDKKYDWRCSNYSFRHANTLLPERKTFAYGTWS